MSAIHPSLFGKPKKIKGNFHHIYAGLTTFFVAAGYHVSSDGTGMVVYDGAKKPDRSLENMVAHMSNFVHDVWGVDIAQFPVEGQKAVGLQLRMPKPVKKR